MRSTCSAGRNSFTSIAPVPRSSRALSSSAVNLTYWPLLNSYPLIIPSLSTTSPSFGQKYCCFNREPHVLCSQLKETAAVGSPAENNLIGRETRPKEIVAEPIA